MTQDEKIREIAASYGKLTGRPEGWERYLSLADYALIREMALKELPMSPQQAPIQPVVEQPPVKKQKEQETKKKIQEAPAQQPATEVHSAEQSPVPQPAQEEQQPEQSELSLFLALGE